MNGTVNVNAIGGAMTTPISASRGILVLQRTGLSSVGVVGTGVEVMEAKVSRTYQPMLALRMDKPSGSWHPAAIEAAVAFAFDAETEQPAQLVLSVDGDTQAARLRTADQATVIRNRHRCRSR